VLRAVLEHDAAYIGMLGSRKRGKAILEFLADAGIEPAALERIVEGRPMTPEQRMARQSAVIAAAESFARGEGGLQPLNPDWDRRLLDIFDQIRLAELDGWTNESIAAEAGNSAHEIRTWVAAFSALATQGDYRTGHHFYRAAPELIAGFAVRTAVPDDTRERTGVPS